MKTSYKGKLGHSQKHVANVSGPMKKAKGIVHSQVRKSMRLPSHPRMKG